MVKVPTLQQLLEAGVHFGHQVRRGHPKMGQYIFGVREGVHIIDLEKSEKMLKEAAEFAHQLGKEGKVLLLVGTKKQAQPIVAELAQKANLPYVDFRWLGGLLTNFDEIRKNIKKLLELKDKKAQGELARYTKKEQLLISRKLEKFDRTWGGVAEMVQLPDAIFVIDCVAEKTALSEANMMGIPVIGIADTNANPQLISHPIPSNDDATKSIRLITETVVHAYMEGVRVSTKKPSGKKEATKPEVSGAEAVSPILEEVAAVEEEVEKETVAESERVA